MWLPGGETRPAGHLHLVLCGVGPVWVLGQNGSGQNGMDKMVWTKGYTDKMV